MYFQMVGKTIKSGGVAITGQEQSDVGASFKWNEKGAGLQGEVTLVQLYKAALSRGKAYSDHKHHHVHQWSHTGDGNEEDGDEETNFDNQDNEQDNGNDQQLQPELPGFENPIFENGQLKHQLEVHNLLAKPIAQDPLYNYQLVYNIERMQVRDYKNVDDYMFVHWRRFFFFQKLNWLPRGTIISIMYQKTHVLIKSKLGSGWSKPS